MRPRVLFFLIIVLTVITGLISMPAFSGSFSFQIFNRDVNLSISSPRIDIPLGSSRFVRDFEIKRGLDIQGGTQLVLSADMTEIDPNDRETALESVREIVSRRVDLYGVSEPVVQTSRVGDDDRILVELPGISDIDSAVQLIGQTAQLDFREIPEDFREATPGSVPIFAFVQTDLTGRDLERASVQFANTEDGSPAVSLEFSDEGREKFAEITRRNIGRQVAIFIDDFPVTAPTVQSEIVDGQAIISGSFDIEGAKQLAIQLNAGALPVPVDIIEQRTIGPSLGEESVQRSVIAGLVGLVVVMSFMGLYYGKMGIIANIALIIYGLITMAIYKLVPITLTLPGIAGFILSVGMAVDANILIFERMREEVRQGRKWRAAMELGFGRAWDSIKDANVATILTALILLNPLDLQWLVTSGSVRGFALTLLIGVLVSMFTGVVVTRTLMRVLYWQREDIK